MVKFNYYQFSAMTENLIPFNRPYMTGKEFEYIKECNQLGQLSGDGKFTKLCNTYMEDKYNIQKALLTHSCTAALEMCAILLNLQIGDEIIMPSYTFVSTANAFRLQGAVPVFVDISPKTLCIDESQIEKAITRKTKAIVVVHYAGMSCDMERIQLIASKHGLELIEDAAQAIGSTYKGKPLGSFGSLATFSFHETKNIISGEGGALLINDQKYIDRAEIIREKGTNRSQFFNNMVDKYTWVDVGSSYLPGELISAFLYAQLEQAEAITQIRLNAWDYYFQKLKYLHDDIQIRLPSVPTYNNHNAHMFYLLLGSKRIRDEFIQSMKALHEISCVFHYIPLHSSPYGEMHCRASGPLNVTNRISDTLVRLPLWVGISKYQDKIIDSIANVLRKT